MPMLCPSPHTIFWTLDALADAMQGHWVAPPLDNVTATGVSIDSRTLGRGEIFFAIKGENFDGHDFVQLALRRGAVLAVVASDQAARFARPGDRTQAILAVDDPTAALQRLAHQWRQVLAELGCRVIAVGGSNGKTTTRHLIHHILTCAGLRGTQSPKSFNNHLGVPLTLLAAHGDNDFVVVEAGTNHPGEMDQLGRIIEPDMAVITSIGREHVAFFPTLEAVAAEEMALLAHLRCPGTVVLPAATLLPVALNTDDLKTGVHVVRFDRDDTTVDLTLPGAHNQHNAAAAATVARLLCVTPQVIRAACASVHPVPMRSQILQLGGATGITLIHDAYNANPDSMAAALAMLLQTPGKRHVAVLGDMLELGQQGPDLHRAVGRQLLALRPPDATIHLVLIGTLSLFTAQSLDGHWPGEQMHVHAAVSDSLPDEVAGLLQPGDVVLIKASRSMRLERLVPAMETRFASPGCAEG